MIKILLGEMQLNAINQGLLLDTLSRFVDNVKAYDNYIYIEDEISVNQRLKFNLGLHVGLFSVEKQNYLKFLKI